METKAELKNASFDSKSNFKLPEGAEVISNTFSINVEEIENGFIVRKSYDIKYQIGERIDYAYHNKKWYSKKNPLKVEMKEIPLEDKFD